VSIEADLLAKKSLDTADGRPLFAYACDEASRARLAHDLMIRLIAGSDNQITAARFVLWAADEIRVAHTPGHLTWEWLFGRLRRPSDPQLRGARTGMVAPDGAPVRRWPPALPLLADG
jgi:hypothetical protein